MMARCSTPPEHTAPHLIARDTTQPVGMHCGWIPPYILTFCFRAPMGSRHTPIAVSRRAFGRSGWICTMAHGCTAWPSAAAAVRRRAAAAGGEHEGKIPGKIGVLTDYTAAPYIG
jgi:hypothetical protein